MSWSALQLWESAPDKYALKYFFGYENSFTNSGMGFGSRISARLDGGDEDEDPTIEMLALLLPKYDTPEHGIRVEMEPGLMLYGELDSFNQKSKLAPKCSFREYKTGRSNPKYPEPWNQNKAQKHGQVHFYATMIKLQYGVDPEKYDIHLDWIETIEELVSHEVLGEEGEVVRIEQRKEVRLTGRIESYPIKLTKLDVWKMKARIRLAAEQITKAYRKHLQTLC